MKHQHRQTRQERARQWAYLIREAARQKENKSVNGVYRHKATAY